MTKFQIRYGLGGSFGELCEWEIIDAKNLDEAMDEAYQKSIEVYESYEGLYGLPTIDEVMESEGVNRQQALEIYEEERESWLDYEARTTDD